MQTFFTNTATSKFIKALVYNTPLPNYNSVRSGDYLIEDNIYIHDYNILKCTKSGYLDGIDVAVPDVTEVFWNSCQLPFNANWVGITASSNIFIAITDDLHIAHSYDGNIWAESTVDSYEGEWLGIAYGDGKFIAISKDANLAISSDGIEWEIKPLEGCTAQLKFIKYVKDKFYIFLDDSEAYFNSYLDYEGNICWESHVMPSKLNWSSMCYGNGIYVLIAKNSNIYYYSTDGKEWVEGNLTVSNAWIDIAYGADKFIIISGGDKYSNEFLYSYLGTTSWNKINIEYSAYWQNIIFDDDIFIITSSDYMLNSMDGIHDWRPTTFPDFFTDIADVILTPISSSDEFKLDKDTLHYNISEISRTNWSVMSSMTVEGRKVFVALNSTGKYSAYGSKKVIEYSYKRDKFAKFRIIGHYDFKFIYEKFTENYISKYNYYDTETHEFLGNFLRYYRDLFWINLMPFYNCFSGRYIENMKLCSTGIENINDDNYKVAQVPIKLNKTYTIALDCSTDIFIIPAAIKNKDKLIATTIIDGKTEKLDITKELISVQGNIHRYPSLSYRSPITIRIENTADTKYESSDMYKKIQKYEKDIYLLIQLPTNNQSSITVLEGDYTKAYCRNVFNIENFYDIEELELDDLLLYNLSLLQFSDSERHPFSNRLIEYLLLNTITSDEDIPGNIMRVEDSINKFNDSKITYGIWQDQLRAILYNKYMNKDKYKGTDINGFVDKDVEYFISKGGVY